ncbi:MAG: hypothetical protein QNK03_27695 [Myxococcota bacterium]|nr:hypothetical protein [Myxococcota bacterium]
MRSAIGVGVGAFLLIAPAAWGQAAGAGGDWPDEHMRSRYRSLLDDPTPASAVVGTDRYEQIQTDTGPAPITAVPETLETESPREWTPGMPRRGRSNAYAGPTTSPSQRLGSVAVHTGRASAGSQLRSAGRSSRHAR